MKSTQKEKERTKIWKNKNEAINMMKKTKKFHKIKSLLKSRNQNQWNKNNDKKKNHKLEAENIEWKPSSLKRVKCCNNEKKKLIKKSVYQDENKLEPEPFSINKMKEQ